MLTHLRSKIIFMISWFIPILASSLYERVDHNVVNLTMVASILLGLVYFILIKNKVLVNANSLMLIILVYGFALFSSISEYTEIIFFISYALLVHLISYNYPQQIFRQYLVVCSTIGILTIVDIIIYNLSGSPFIMRTDIHSVSDIVLRSSTIFDEPLAQAIFTGPAFYMYMHIKLFNSESIYLRTYRGFWLMIAVAYLATFSLTAYIIFVLFVVIAFINKKKISFRALLSGAFIISVLYGFGITAEFTNRIDLLIAHVVTPDNGSASAAATLYANYDVIANSKLHDILSGVGYYNVSDTFKYYLSLSNHHEYYQSIGVYEHERYSPSGILHILYGYGLILILFMCFLVYKILNNLQDKTFPLIVLFVIFISILKTSHNIGEQTYIFLFFGLIWASCDLRTSRKPLPQDAIYATNVSCTRRTICSTAMLR